MLVVLFVLSSIALAAAQPCVEDEVVSFESRQIAGATSCPPLAREHCSFIHEARDKCPCTCAKRAAGEDVNGVGEMPAPPPLDEDGDGEDGDGDGEDGDGVAPECSPNPCAEGEICTPEPKQCITTPCDQFRCDPDGDGDGAGGDNGGGDEGGDGGGDGDGDDDGGGDGDGTNGDGAGGGDGDGDGWTFGDDLPEYGADGGDGDLSETGETADEGLSSDFGSEDGADGEGGAGGEGGNGLLCFHADSVVQTQSGPVRMAALPAIKDALVLSWNRAANAVQFSPVKLWLHADPTVNAKFLHLTAGDRQLLITENHLIYRSISCDASDVETVLAGDLKIGHCLMTENSGKLAMSPIENIKLSYKQGIYAPVTEEGSVIVDNVVASCFAQNPNEKLQKVIQSYVFIAKTMLSSLLPSNLMAQLFGGDSQIPSVYLALERLQRSFL